MARKIKGQPQQPRAITSESQAIQPYYRAGMRAELQKFGYSQEVRQLMLGEDTDIQDPEKRLEIYGLDLSLSEDKALHAVQKLLDRTNYKGNTPGQQITSTAFKWEGFIPRLSITYSDYYEAYGLKKNKDQYQGRQAQEALLALRSLTETRRICYKRDKWTGSGKGKRKLSDIIRATEPLIRIVEGFKDLDAEEAEIITSGGELPKRRQTKLLIECSPLLVDQIDSFYLLKPSALFSEIQALAPGKRISKTDYLFIQWLLTLDKKTWQVSTKALANKLRLDYLITQRKPTLINTKLQEALQVAKETGYLLDYEEKPIGLLVLTLNPEKCKRINMVKKTKKIKEEA
jgi:hypothetical protein